MGDWELMVMSARGGDLSAFDAIVRRFQDMAVGYAYSLLKDFHLAEDAAQEAFLQAFRDLRSLREPAAFPAWLRRLVFKHCDRITRRKRLPVVPLQEAAEVADAGAGPLDALEQQETEAQVLGAVEALSEKERTATTLFYINGYSLDEVSGFLEVPVGTVKRRLHSARTHLRERMVPLVEDTLKQHAPGEEFTRRVRQALEGVPLVSFSLHNLLPGWSPETTCFSSCLRSVMEYLGTTCDGSTLQRGDPGWHTTYIYLMGASGEAYRFFYPVDGYRFVEGVRYMTANPTEGIERAFRAAGLGCEILLKSQGHGDESEYRARILRSIAEDHRPVLAFGVVGAPECCLITGFDEGGDVLLGWSFFQEEERGKPGLEFEPNGYFRKRAWFEETEGIVLVGAPAKRPEVVDVLRESAAWGLQIQRTLQVGDAYTGLRALDAWVDALEGGGIPAENLPEAGSFFAGMLAEARCWGNDFLGWCLDQLPSPSPSLGEVAECYRVIHDLVWCFWRTTEHWQGGEDRLKDPALREELGRIARLIRFQDAEGNAYLEKGLLEMGTRAHGIPPLPEEVAHPEPIPSPERPRLRWRSGLKGFFEYPFGFVLQDAPGPDGWAGWCAAKGLRSRSVDLPTEGRSGAVEQLNTDVVLSTRAGIPVVAQYAGETGLIVGYQIWAREWLLKHPRADGEFLRVPYSDPKLGDHYTFADLPG